MTHQPSFSANLQWDPSGGTAWGTAFRQVGDIEGFSPSRNNEEITDRSQTDYFMDYIPTMVDPGELSFVFNDDPNYVEYGGSAGTSLYESMSQGACTVPKWKYNYSLCNGTAYWIFDGFVTELTHAAPLEGVHNGEVTIKVTGKPTFYWTPPA